MNVSYGRDLDLNLLRVFLAVADAGSVTGAAARLYVTQPAVSAALRRLGAAVGAPLLARQGRGVVLTARGERLAREARPHLEALVEAALSPLVFDPRTSERTFRLGLAAHAEGWLLPRLLHVLRKEAPRMQIISLPVQFRTLPDLLARRLVDLAVSVADELPAGTHRETLYQGGFVCLFDPRHGRAPTRRSYFEREHVVVSYNGDTRGIVENAVGRSRKVRVSVTSFRDVGAIVEGTDLVATVPASVARHLVAERRALRTAPVPFRLGGAPMELIWRGALDGDEACRFLRDRVGRIARELAGGELAA